MLKTMKTRCIWCGKEVTAVLRYGEWCVECSVCHDEFTIDSRATRMSSDETKCNQEAPNA